MILVAILTWTACRGAVHASRLTRAQGLKLEVTSGTEMADFLEKTFTDAKQEAKKLKLAGSVTIGSKTLQLPSVYFSKTPADDNAKPPILKSIQQGIMQVNGKVGVDMELTFVAKLDNVPVVLGSGGAFVRMKFELYTHDFEVSLKPDFAWSPEGRKLQPADSNEKSSLAYKLRVLLGQEIHRRLQAAAKCGNMAKLYE